jgi:hypothetical protein
VVGTYARANTLVRPAHEQLIAARPSSTLPTYYDERMRSRVANFARALTTIVRQPSCFVVAESASAVSTAPMTTRRRGRLVDVGEDPPVLVLQYLAPAGPEQAADLGRELRRRVRSLALARCPSSCVLHLEGSTRTAHNGASERPVAKVPSVEETRLAAIP